MLKTLATNLSLMGCVLYPLSLHAAEARPLLIPVAELERYVREHQDIVDKLAEERFLQVQKTPFPKNG